MAVASVRRRRFGRAVVGTLAAAVLFAASPSQSRDFAHPAFYIAADFGADDRARLGQLAHDANLRLELVARGAGAVLRGAAVSVFAANGDRVIDAIAAGGWLLAHLPPGRYRVVVEDGERRDERLVWLTGNASRTLRFAW